MPKKSDTIELNGTYYVTKPIEISKSLTIQGNSNATLDGKSSSVIFNIKDCDVVFENINFINAYNKDEYSGGAINAEYSSIKLINCTFINNKALGYGGALYAQGCSISVSDSVFENNTASKQGGAIWTDNIYDNTNSLTVKDSTFINNHANYGGAISTSAALSISNSNFKSNSAKYGGAIDVNYMEYADPGDVIADKKANIANTVFSNNKATKQGGAIYSNAKLVISKSSFDSNYADAAGSISIASGTAKISGTTFSKNSYGNILFSLYNDYTGTWLDGKLSIDNTQYSKGVCLDNDLKRITLMKVTAKKVNTVYRSGDKLTIKLTNIYSKKPVSNAHILLKIGKKYYHVYTNSKGVANFKASTLKAGKYKVLVAPSNDGYVPFKKAYVSVIVKKAKTTVKAPKVTAKYKKSKYFKVTVKHKKTKKPVQGVKVKIKVYTGKKFKTYKVKTNKKGIAKLNTKKLKWGKHKVVITSADPSCKISAKSTIRIK